MNSTLGPSPGPPSFKKRWPFPCGGLPFKVLAKLLFEPGRGRDDGRHLMRLIVLACIHHVDPRVNDTRVKHAVGAVALARLHGVTIGFLKMNRLC
jgi:hypothetical protein